MTLLTRHIEAGWHEVEAGASYAAEKLVDRPGYTSTTIRESAETQEDLHRRIDTREMLFGGDHRQPVKDVITDDGTLVTTGQHAALKTEGVVVPDAVPPLENAVVPSADFPAIGADGTPVSADDAGAQAEDAREDRRTATEDRRQNDGESPTGEERRVSDRRAATPAKGLDEPGVQQPADLPPKAGDGPQEVQHPNGQDPQPFSTPERDPADEPSSATAPVEESEQTPGAPDASTPPGEAEPMPVPSEEDREFARDHPREEVLESQIDPDASGSGVGVTSGEADTETA